MSEMSDFKTTYGENGEKWRWRICLFHLSNSPLAPLPLPLSLWYNLKLEKFSQPSSLDISKNVHFNGAQHLPHKRGKIFIWILRLCCKAFCSSSIGQVGWAKFCHSLWSFSEVWLGTQVGRPSWAIESKAKVKYGKFSRAVEASVKFFTFHIWTKRLHLCMKEAASASRRGLSWHIFRSVNWYRRQWTCVGREDWAAKKGKTMWGGGG